MGSSSVGFAPYETTGGGWPLGSRYRLDIHKFLVRIPDELWRLLVQQAAAEERSVNQQVVWVLRRELEGYTRRP